MDRTVNASVVKHQMAAYVNLSNISFDQMMADLALEEQCSKIVDKAAKLAEALLSALPCWTKQELSGSFAYDFNPYELCEVDTMCEDVDGKACYSLWVHCEGEIPLEDMRQMKDALIQAFRDAAKDMIVYPVRVEQMREYRYTERFHSVDL